MMLSIKGELTAAVTVGGRPRTGAPGAAAEMNNLRDRGEVDLAAVGADGCAKIHVLAVHEIAFVEEAGGFGVGSPHEHARSRHPVHLPRLRRQPRERERR